MKTGADKTAEEDMTDKEAELLKTANELAEELPEGETAELEAEPCETDNDPL